MGELGKAYKILVENHEVKTQLRRPAARGRDNVKYGSH
jgi:hypothetical protein